MPNFKLVKPELIHEEAFCRLVEDYYKVDDESFYYNMYKDAQKDFKDSIQK